MSNEQERRKGAKRIDQNNESRQVGNCSGKEYVAGKVDKISFGDLLFILTGQSPTKPEDHNDNS